jgi:hypothetical protein
MAEFAYLDESLDINQTGMYHTSIQVGLNGLSFCILDTVSNKYVALKHYPLIPDDATGLPDRIREVVKKDEFLGRSFKSVAVIPVSQRATVVPAPLYREKDKEIFFRFNFPPEEGETIRSSRIKAIDAWSVFALRSDLAQVIEESFPGARLCHQTVPFLESIVRYLWIKGKEPALFLNIHDDFFDIAVFRGQTPLLINAFRYRQVNDMIYFILYTLKTLEMDPALSPVILQGKINTASGLINSLKRYVKKISFAGRDPSFVYSYTFNMVPEHTFVNLFNLYPCV